MTPLHADAHLRLALSVAMSKRQLVPVMVAEMALEHLATDTLTAEDLRLALCAIYGYDPTAVTG